MLLLHFLKKRKSCLYFPKVFPNRTFGEYILKTFTNEPGSDLCQLRSVSHLGYPKQLILLTALISIEGNDEHQ